MKVYWLLAMALVACTKRNPAVCCLDAADCNEAGLSEVRNCAAGLACVEHECKVPTCSMTGCEAATPVCNITTDVCEGCTESSNCSKFSDTDVCDTATGACVECVGAADCNAANPICDANACRACKLDSECPAGACGDGACIDESSIVYMDPGGTDAGSCTRPTPCRTFTYSITQASSARSHIVMQQGTYVDADVQIGPEGTAAPSLFIHGGGATLAKTPTNDGGLIYVSMAATIRDLDFFCEGGGCVALGGAGAIRGENLRLQGGYVALNTAGNVSLRNVRIMGTGNGIVHSSGSLTIDRAVIQANTTGVSTTQSGAIVDMTNTLIYGTSGLAVDLFYSTGSITASTIADAGSDTGSGPRAVRCGNGTTVRSSIWSPGTVPRAPVEGCNLVATIAGPTPAPGALNTNPLFVDSANRDYRIAPSSPARDAVDSGPGTDFEGDPRPQGARFDIGADETAP